MICLSSLSGDFRNFRRAGTLKNRFFTTKVVPAAQAVGSCRTIFDAAISINVPNSASACRVCSSTAATAAIEARASPRNPIVCSLKRSAVSRILDVACRSNAIRASVCDIPLPLSDTFMKVLPESLTDTEILSAPASIAFSTSSLTTEAGRCITSPAAI